MMPFPENYRVYVMMRLVGSPVVRALGYLPGWLGLGEDLPKGVFLEWTNWVMKPRYFFDDPTLDALANFPRYSGALRAVGFSDDPWAPPATIDLLVERFSGAQIERLHIRPPDVGAERIGHFGFFRPEHRNTLWRQAAEWLE
jgi:predicted alpha/beta hydrolase